MKLRASIVCTAILLLSLDTAGQDREVAVHRPDSSGVRPISTEEAYRLACAHNEMTENMQYDEALENYRIALEYISMCDLSDSTVLVTKDIIEYNIASVHADMAAEEAFRTGNFTEAIELTEKALAMFTDIYGTENEEYANGLNLLADYCYNNGEYGKAIDYGKEAAEITLELSGEQDAGYAVLIYNLGMYHSYSGDFRTAIPYFEEAAGILEKTDRVMYARCIEDLSDCHDALGDYGKAVEYLTEATDLLSDMDDEESMKEYIYGLKELASLYSTLNDYPEALELATKAAGLQESRFGENTEEYIDILKDISDYNLYLGYFPASNEALEKAAVLGEEVFDKYSIKYIGMLVDLGGRQYSSGEYAKAGATFTDVTGKMQHILSEPDRLSPADKLLLVKQYYKFLDVFLEASLEISYQAAESTANEFLQAMQDAGQDIPAGRCSILETLSTNASLREEYDKAIGYLKEELSVSEKAWGKNTFHYANALNRMAVAYANAGDYDKAVNIGTEAMKTADLAYSGIHEYHIWHRTNLTTYFEDTGRIQEMTFYANEATEMLAGLIRQSFAGMTSAERQYFYDSHKAWLENDIHHYAFRYPSDSLAANAYNGILLAKGLLLNSEMEFSRLMQESGDKDALRLYDEWRAVLQERDRLREIQDTNTDLLDSLNAAAHEKERELIRKSEVFGDYTENLAINWEQVRDRLHENEAAVEFAAFQTGQDSTMYIAYILKKGMQSPKMIPLFEEKELSGSDRTLWYTAPLVSNMVWGPLEKFMEGTDAVYFSPAGELYNIAIENLPDTDGEGFLSDTRRYYRLSSTRELALHRNGDAVPGKAAVYGGLQYDMSEDALTDDAERYGIKHYGSDRGTADTLRRSVYASGLPEYLPATMTEAESIVRLLGKASVAAEIYTGGAGTETSFKALSGKRTGLIHLATHGFYWNGHERTGGSGGALLSSSMPDTMPERYREYKAMTRSGLLFSGASLSLSGHKLPDNTDDGILTAQEISTLDLRGLDLVVLSACQTGLGQVSGDGVFGLQRGFKKAGAQTLLMSLWSVDDKATQMLMERFYSNLVSGKDKYQALHEARQYLREYETETVLPDNRSFMEKRRDEEAGVEYVPETVKYRPYTAPEYWAAFILMDAAD